MINSGRWARLLAVVGTAGALSACGVGQDAPASPPATAVAVQQSPAPSGGPPPRYDVRHLDLCALTDLRLLDGLHLKLERKRPETVWHGGCYFQMRTSGGQEAELLVMVQTPESHEDAVSVYKSHSNEMRMQPAGPVDSVGDEAVAFTRRSYRGFEYSQYMICARYANMVVKVWLAVGGKTLVPSSKLAPKALSVLTATYRLVAAG